MFGKSALNVAILSVFGVSTALAQDQWHKNELVDRMRDTKTTVFSTMALDPIDCGYGPERPQLHLSCDNAPVVGVQTESCTLSQTMFYWRIDGSKMDSIMFKPSASGTYGSMVDHVAWLEGKLSAPNFANKIISGKSLLLEFRPEGGSKSVVEFDISALDQVAGDALSGCRSNAQPQPAPARDRSGSIPARPIQPKTSAPSVFNMSSGSIDPMVIEALACRKSPEPGPIMQALKDGGYLDMEHQMGSDGVSCYGIPNGLNIKGMRFDAVCGFDEDEQESDTYSEFWSRGPGTSPGTRFELTSPHSEDELSAWYAREVRADIPSGSLGTIDLYINGEMIAKPAISCVEWMIN